MYLQYANSRKSVRLSAEPVPCLSRLCLKMKGKQGSGPKGVDDLCFHTYEEFSPPSSNWDWGLRAGILGGDSGFMTGIWASRLEFGPRDWDLRGRDGGGGGEGEDQPYV